QYQFFATKSLNPGLYQLVVRAEGETFKRDLLTSFVLKKPFEAPHEEKEDLTPDWKIYPNPSNGLTTVRFNKLSDNSVITIYSLKGEVLEQKSITGGSKSVELSVLDYQPGVYLVELVHQNNRQIQKLLIKK
ncbi:MAG: T9SS type A sorting domain-containing protein, partial [Bacteroidota bacterium]